MEERIADYKVEDLMIKRWSPRAMSGEAISKDELFSLFEAARWAPSSRNEQPWKLIYSLKDSDSWNNFQNLLMEANGSWAKNAAALILITSKRNHDYKDKPNITHNFDVGAAWENIALQATANKLACHGMAGFDHEEARMNLKIPENYDIDAMVAIGKPGKVEDLPEDYQKLEFPSPRKKVEEFISEGVFK